MYSGITGTEFHADIYFGVRACVREQRLPYPCLFRSRARPPDPTPPRPGFSPPNPITRVIPYTPLNSPHLQVVYYQRLRHMVSDKFQVRTTGPVHNLTQQPVKVRAGSPRPHTIATPWTHGNACWAWRG